MNSESVRQMVTVNLENGLHLVPCSKIAKLARRFDCEVCIIKDDLIVDAKDVFALPTLVATCGTSLILAANGKGAQEVVDELVRMFESNFEDDTTDSA